MADPESLSAPERITREHDLAAFDSGVHGLDYWLKRWALSNDLEGGSRTYVVCAADRRVVAYYSLATGAVTHQVAGSRVIGIGMPQPVPVVVLGKLAVDQAYQGKGLGTGLLRDAVLRTLQAAEIIGIRAILLHAASEEAKRFYEKHGFYPSEVEPMTMMITLADAQAALKN